jgi:hypothetical protein
MLLGRRGHRCEAGDRGVERSRTHLHQGRRRRAAADASNRLHVRIGSVELVLRKDAGLGQARDELDTRVGDLAGGLCLGGVGLCLGRSRGDDVLDGGAAGQQGEGSDENKDGQLRDETVGLHGGAPGW